MEITTELVNHLADLSRLEFNAQETENFKAEFAQTLEHMSKLNSIDTSGVELKQNKLNAEQDLDQDCPKQGISRADALSGAPETLGSSIAVPMMVD